MSPSFEVLVSPDRPDHQEYFVSLAGDWNRAKQPRESAGAPLMAWPS